MGKRRATWASAVLLASVGLIAMESAPLPDDGEYVVAKGDHLVLKGELQRYWGVIGGFPYAADFKGAKTDAERAAKIKEAYADVDALVQRFIDLGFNLNRSWKGFGATVSYNKGDGSDADITDYYLSVMKKRGLKIWAAGINNLGDATPSDVGIIDDPATAEAWKAAVGGWDNGKVRLGGNIARKWDARLEKLGIERRRAAAQHFNQHTGLRWSDDPVFVAWELSNEEWWISKMNRGEWRRLPKFFQDELYQQWNAFLKAKYKDDAGLRASWKSLLPGESLAKGTVLLVPIAGKQDMSSFGMDEQAKKQLLAAQNNAGDGGMSRDDFARERGEDVLAFFVHLHTSSKQREAEALKTYGKSCKLSPLVWDTGIGYEIQAQYMHQLADVSAHDAYVNGWGWNQPMKDKYDCEQCKRLDQVGMECVAANRGPWNCWLLKPPNISQGVPWLEHNKVDGQPFFCYETQIQQPAKYRADFPFRLGGLASIQDWSIACWHYYAPPRGLSTNPRPFDKTMDVTVGQHPQGYHYTFDEVQTAMMRAAGMIWRQELLKPAPKPTRFIYGRKTLCDPLSMDYGHSYGRTGLDMDYTVYQYGVRIGIDPTREDDQVIGPVVSFDDRNKHNPYTPTKEMTIDWKKGCIVWDAPGVAGFTGFLPAVGGKVIFQNGVELSNVDINNPPGLYDPITNEEGYIGFAYYTEDGKSLAECKAAAISLVSTSFNAEFSLSKTDFEKAGCPDHPLAAKADKNRKWGKEPVLVARVAGTIKAKALHGMRYTFLDWHMKPLGEGAIGGGELRIPNDQPVFLVRLTRE